VIDNSESNEERHGGSFADQAEGTQPGIFAEFFDFLIHNKKWWLTPIVLVLFLVGVLIVLGGTPAAPFIYTIF
jgi:uncharacterized protein YdaL